TSGNWEADPLEGVDEDKEIIYFAATEHSHIGPQAYSIKLDGTDMKRLTSTEGTHRINFSPEYNYFIDTWSDINTPAQIRLLDSSGKLVRVVSENKVDALKQYKLGTPELMQVKTRDGFV